MRIRGRLVFKGDEEMVSIIARSLAPDNLSEIKTACGENSAEVTFSSDKIGTMLSSVDDYLMNATIVEKLSYSVKPDQSMVNG